MDCERGLINADHKIKVQKIQFARDPKTGVSKCRNDQAANHNEIGFQSRTESRFPTSLQTCLNYGNAYVSSSAAAFVVDGFRSIWKCFKSEFQGRASLWKRPLVFISLCWTLNSVSLPLMNDLLN